jgi:hypothetical protein
VVPGHGGKILTTEITEITEDTEEEKANSPRMNADEHG